MRDQQPINGRTKIIFQLISAEMKFILSKFFQDIFVSVFVANLYYTKTNANTTQIWISKLNIAIENFQ